MSADRRGAAAVEMALVLPFFMALLFGSIELGNYFWNEHVLAKGMRNGAVFASRLPIDNFDCSTGTPTLAGTVADQIKQVVATGEVSGGSPRLPRWSEVTFAVNLACVTQVGPTDGRTTLSGIYTLNGGKIPVLTISASVPYRSLLSTLGLANPSLHLNATQEAAVVGA